MVEVLLEVDHAFHESIQQFTGSTQSRQVQPQSLKDRLLGQQIHRCEGDEGVLLSAQSKLPQHKVHVGFDSITDVVEHPIGFVNLVELGGLVEEMVLDGCDRLRK